MFVQAMSYIKDINEKKHEEAAMHLEKVRTKEANDSKSATSPPLTCAIRLRLPTGLRGR